MSDKISKNYTEKYDWILAVGGRELSITGIDLSKFYGTAGEAEEKLDDHMQKEIDYLKKQGYLVSVPSCCHLKDGEGFTRTIEVAVPYSPRPPQKIDYVMRKLDSLQKIGGKTFYG